MAERQDADLEHGVLVAIIVLLLSGLTASALVQRLALLLGPLGVPAPAVLTLVTLLAEEAPEVTAPAAAGQPSALAAMQRSQVARRAMYALAAARRLAEGGTVGAERALLRAHLAAERRRFDAARAVDRAAAEHGPLLGWWSQRDERTTPACFAAHGGNFYAASPPAMGYPGTIHAGNCRCKPVAPWPGGDILEGSVPALEDRLLVPLES